MRRSLEAARIRTDARIQRLLDVARTVIIESPEADFTVGEVAARAGISLKTLYQWFDSKDELLLALLEQECRLGAVMLRQAVETCNSPAERLERSAEVVFELTETAPEYARLIYRQHQRLSLDHRPEVWRALAPMVQVVETEIRRANEVGAADAGDPARAAELVFSLLLDGLAIATSSRADRETVASIWRFIAGGLRLKEFKEGPAREGPLQEGQEGSVADTAVPAGTAADAKEHQP